MSKVNQRVFNEVKEFKNYQDRAAIELLVREFKLSETTIRRILKEPTYVAYRLSQRKHTDDWLIRRGYQDTDLKWAAMLKKPLSKVRGVYRESILRRRRSIEIQQSRSKQRQGAAFESLGAVWSAAIRSAKGTLQALTEFRNHQTNTPKAAGERQIPGRSEDSKGTEV